MVLFFCFMFTISFLFACVCFFGFFFWGFDILFFVSIEISGGTVTAHGGATNGAGIGGGGSNGYATAGSGGTITITGGTVIATGGPYSAGIGGGGFTQSTASANTSPQKGAGSSGTITITGGTVTASGGTGAPGIGSGSRKDTSDSQPTTAGAMGTITISDNAVVEAVNGNGYTTSLQLSDGSDNLSTGVGQGQNAGTSAVSDYNTWELQTAGGAAMYLLTSSGVSDLRRNDVAYAPATLKIESIEYYLLPEGVYTGTGISGTLLVASDADKTTVESLINSLNAVDVDNIDVATVQTCESTYNTLSETLQYYVDNSVTEKHTIEKLKEALKEQNVHVTVTLNCDGGSGVASSKSVIYGSAADLGVPTKANYTFTGWYLDSELIVDTTGTITSWPYISNVTLTAGWKSEITGSGTVGSPYVLQSASNLIALSHISLNIGTAEEFSLFGKTNTTADRTALLEAYYELSDTWDTDDVLRTSDKFYGINGFKGTFDGNNQIITLAIDTSNIVDLTDMTTAPGSSSTRGKYNTINDTYVEISGGLFITATGATIENLTTAGNVNLVVNGTFAGVVVGSATNTIFKNVINKANLTMNSTDNTNWAGGIAGLASGTSATFTNCTNKGNITAGADSTYTNVGNSAAAGIVAYVSGPTSGFIEVNFTDCTNSGELYATRATEVAGRNTYAAGIMSGNATNLAALTLTRCSNTGCVTAAADSNNTAAGLCVLSSAVASATVTINNCTNSGTVKATDGYAGLLVSSETGVDGIPSNAVYTSSSHIMSGSGELTYYVGDTEAEYDAASNVTTLCVPVTKNTENFYDSSRYVTDGTGAKVADIVSADGHQVYNTFDANENIQENEYPFQSWEDAYEISSAEDYVLLVQAIQGDEDAQKAVLGTALSGATAEARAVALATAYVVITADFTLDDLTAIGLGTAGIAFSGHIDGQNHTVTYALSTGALTEENAQNIGLIGVSSGAEIKNLNFAGTINITVDPENGNNVYAGAAVANGSGAVLTNCHSAVTYTVSRTSTVLNATGGFLYVGGLIGSQSAATITDSSQTGDVTVTAPKFAYAGGMGGSLTDAVINGCTVKGNITANLVYDSELPIFGENAYAGGIAGSLSGTIDSSIAAGFVTATNDVPTGASVSATYGHAYAGGLVGYSGSSVTVTDSAALTTVTAKASRDAATYANAGSVLGSGTPNTSGTNWSVTTSTLTGVGNAIDMTAMDGGVYGESDMLYAGALPDGIASKSDIAELDAATGSVLYTSAGSGTISLLYDGQVFYTSESLTVSALDISSEAIITGVNSSYRSDDEAANANITVLYGDVILTAGIDYTVQQNANSDTFVVTFTGNYAGTKSVSYTVDKNAINITVSDYIETYDGKPHTVTVSAEDDVAVTYRESASGAYGETIPALTDVGTKIVYWQAVKGTSTVTGKAVISIAAAEPSLALANKRAAYTGKAIAINPVTITLVNNETYTGVITYTYYSDASCTTKIEVPSAVGTYYVVASIEASGNYTAASALATLEIYRKSTTGGSSDGSSSSSATRTVTVEDVDNGAVTSNRANAASGTTVTLTVTPDDGYELDELTVTNVSTGETIKLTQISDTQYTFTMPAAKVAIDATFVEIGESEPTDPVEPAEQSFLDVAENDWYYDAIQYVYEKGLMTGTSATTFEPDLATSRAMLVTILYRLEGEPTVAGTSGFTDVVDGEWYADAVTWAAQNGIVNGLGDGLYGVHNTLTREQMAAILYRYAQYKGYDVSVGASTNILSYTDAQEIGEWAVEAMQWANGAGLITGVTESTLAPQSDSTRAVMATILMRFCENVAE